MLVPSPSLCRSELQGGSARIYLIVVEGLRISTAVRDSATSIGLNPKSHTWREALLPYMYLGMKPNWLKKDRKTDKINTKMKMSPVSATHDEMSGLTSAGNVRKRTAEGVIHVRACAWEHVLWTEICMNYIHQAVHLPYSLDWPKKSSYEAAFSQLVLSSGGREGGEARQKGKEGIEREGKEGGGRGKRDGKRRGGVRYRYARRLPKKNIQIKRDRKVTLLMWDKKVRWRERKEGVG